MGAVLDECDRASSAAERSRSLHLNDSQTPLGSNRDRHANIGDGELGAAGCMAFLIERRVQELPCVLETPGENREGPSNAEVALGDEAARARAQGPQARGSQALSAGRDAHTKVLAALSQGGLRDEGYATAKRAGAKHMLQLGAQSGRRLHAVGLAEAQTAGTGARVHLEHHLGACRGSSRALP